MADATNDKALHQLMQNRLDDEGIRILCDYIKVDVPSLTDLDPSRLEGTGVSGKALSMIRYCRQRQILHTLIENLHLVRPDLLHDNYAAWLMWATVQDNPQTTSSPAPPSDAPAPMVNPVATTQDNLQATSPAANPVVTTPAKRRLRDELAEELYEELEAANDNKDWDRAISIGQNILTVNLIHQPTKDKLKLAYIERGDVYYKQKQYEKALADYYQAIRLDPNFAKAYIYRGDVYYNQKQYEQALSEYNQAIRLNPNDELTYNNRGVVYYFQKQYEQALADFDQAIRIDPNYAKTYINRGLVYSAQLQYEQALADYNQAIRIDPSLAMAYNNRGYLYHNQRKYEQALADYNQAIRLDPNNAIFYSNRGNAYRSKDDKARAIADYVRILELSDDESLRQRAEQSLKDLGVG